MFAEIISVVSLGIAGLALWRTEVRRVEDLGTSVDKGRESLLLTIDKLVTDIPLRVQSRQRVVSVTGNIGSAQAMQIETEKDLPALQGLKSRVNAIGSFPFVGGSRAASEASVEVHRIELLVKQLKDKYDGYSREDEVQRAEIRAAAAARGLAGRK